MDDTVVLPMEQLLALKQLDQFYILTQDSYLKQIAYPKMVYIEYFFLKLILSFYI